MTESPKRIRGSTEQQRRARAVVTKSVGTKTIASATLTLIDFDVEVFDNVGLHSTTVNNSRLTVPSTGRISGLWMLHGHIQWVGAAGGSRQLRLWKNKASGVPVLVALSASPGLGVADFHTMDVWRYVDDPQSGDYYELEVYQDSGAPLNLITVAESTYFEIIHLW